MKLLLRVINYLKIIAILTIMLIGSNNIFAKEKMLVSDNKINPVKTWVFVVGVLEWQDSENFSSFPKENRRDAALVNYFKSIGVEESQIVYLQDKSATINNIQNSIANFLKQTSPEDFLFLYYCGHGYEREGETFFASYDASQDVEGWKVSSILSSIEKHFNGNKVFLAADCCYSGSLVKGLETCQSKISYASLTSSSFDEESTANWTFTDCLLDALLGENTTDLNNDGQITLEELTSYTKMNMLFGERQHAQFIVTGNFNSSLLLSSASKKTDPRIGRYVKAKLNNKYYSARIVAVNNSQVKVHYIGYDKTDDEWISLNQIRFVNPTNILSNKNLSNSIKQKESVKWSSPKIQGSEHKATWRKH